MNKFLLLGLGAIILLAGCDKVPGAANLPGVKQAVNQRVTEEMFAEIDDPILKKHMVAQANETAFRISSSSSGRGTVQVNEMELKGEDFGMSSWEDTNGTKANEMIMMGDTTYLKDYKDNTWWKQTATKDELQTNVEDEAVREPIDFKEIYGEFKSNVTYKNLGEEACGQLTCYKYQETDSTNPEGLRLFWFDTKDYLMRREESKYGEYTSTAEYSYDGINVKAPSPTKDVPEGKNIYEYMIYGGAGVPAGLDDMEQANGEDIEKLKQEFKNSLPGMFQSDEAMPNDQDGGEEPSF